MTRLSYAYVVDNPLNLDDPTGLILGIPGTPSWSDLATRFVGFWDGLTRPLAGGAAALRGAFGLNGGLETCSNEYETASEIGRADVSFEIGALAGGGVKNIAREIIGRGLLTPAISTFAGGVAGAYAQTIVSGRTPTPSTAAQGAAGGLLGEFGTGFFSGRSAEGVSGGVSAVYGLLN